MCQTQHPCCASTWLRHIIGRSSMDAIGTDADSLRKRRRPATGPRQKRDQRAAPRVPGDRCESSAPTSGRASRGRLCEATLPRALTRVRKIAWRFLAPPARNAPRARHSHPANRLEQPTENLTLAAPAVQHLAPPPRGRRRSAPREGAWSAIVLAPNLYGAHGRAKSARSPATSRVEPGLATHTVALADASALRWHETHRVPHSGTSKALGADSERAPRSGAYRPP
jgi:hypothetical protein